MENPLEVAKLIESKLREKGIKEYLVEVVRERKAMVKYANNVVTAMQSWSTIRGVVYGAHDGKYVVIETPITIDAVDEIVNKIVNALEHVAPSPFYAPLPQPNGSPLQNTVDPKIRDSLDDIVPLAHEVIEEALKEGAKRVGGSLEAGYTELALVTSTGFEGVQPHTYIKVYARAFVDDLSGHWAWGSSFLSEKDLRQVGEIAGHYATLTKKLIKAEPGKYEAILSPLVVGNLVSGSLGLGLMASAFLVLMGMSVFSKIKPGTKAFSEKLTVIDAPNDTELPNSRGFDDEGIKCVNKPIIEQGVFKGYLHNSKTAKIMNSQTTGNAGIIVPTPWNIVIEGGDDDLDNMVRDVKRGFLVLNNWYTRFQNAVEGIFSTVTRDALLYIENGEIKGVCKRLRIAGNIVELFSKIEALTRERYNVWWWEVEVPTRAPYIRVSEATFTSAEV